MRAATPADAEEVSGLIGLGAERLAVLFAELDDRGDERPVAA